MILKHVYIIFLFSIYSRLFHRQEKVSCGNYLKYICINTTQKYPLIFNVVQRKYFILRLLSCFRVPQKQKYFH